VKKAIPYEIAATILALLGSLLLRGLCLPLIDPEKVRHGMQSDPHPLLEFIDTVAMLVASWHFNRKGIQYRREIE
jgi:hypothetical protein